MKVFASTSALYTAAQAYALDAAAIASGIPAITLMKRAGRTAFQHLLERFGEPELITVYCGAGNNGGDGYVVAALAAQRRLPVQIIQLTPPEKLQGDARAAYDYAAQEAVPMFAFGSHQAPTAGVIVDALLGIGLNGAPSDKFAQAIDEINQSGLAVIALDIPSGLNGDTGAVAGAAVKAGMTITFIGLKRGLLTGRGPALCGKLLLEPLAIHGDILDQQPPSAQRLSLHDLLPLLKPRAADAHKGDFGHLLVIGGDTGYGGAALMAAESAARTGAGLVSIATRPEHIPAILARRPEVMAVGVVSGQELEPWLSRPSVLVVGPGLGRSPWSEQMLQQAVKSQLPMVLDADALNIIAEGRVVPNAKGAGRWVLTPHPAEAARLLGISTEAVQADRFAAVEALAQRYEAVVILKGAGSLIAASGDLVGLVTDGNPGMATAGMGDILAGIIGALIAQGMAIGDAARLGAVLHACAADLAAEDLGQRSMLATDLLSYLGQLLAEVEAH